MFERFMKYAPCPRSVIRVLLMVHKRVAPVFLISIIVISLAVGCQTPASGTGTDRYAVSNERHLALFGDFELPRKIGSVPNTHLQLPAVSPDGAQMLYLLAEGGCGSMMTLLGSPEPADTPYEGTLAVWIRPLSGIAPGRRLSQARWAHSPVWSDSGRAVAYVVNEPPVSFIVHVELSSGEEHRLGVPDAINCLPQFNRDDDDTVLFCSGPAVNGPLRIYRQSSGDSEPIPLTPEGMDCLFPVLFGPRGHLVCARAEGDHLNWVRAGPGSAADLVAQGSVAERPHLLQTWAGIASTRSPDGQSFMFFDVRQNRIAVYHNIDQRVIRHRQDSIAACWLSNDAIALATSEGVFAVNTITGLSLVLFDGSWIPCCYVPAERKLLLLGRESPRRFSIVEVVFKTR